MIFRSLCLGVFLNTKIYIWKTTTLPSCFFNPCHGARPVTGSKRNYNVTTQDISGWSGSAWGTHFLIIESQKAIGICIFTIIYCISLFLIPDSIFSFDCLIQTRYGTGTLYLLPHLWFQPSVRISFSSWNCARSSWTFDFLHPPVSSAVTGNTLWIPIQLGYMQHCRNCRGDSFKNTEIKTAGEKEPDSAFQKKIEQAEEFQIGKG